MYRFWIFLIAAQQAAVGFSDYVSSNRDTNTALKKASDFVARLSLTEKINMITGVQGLDAGGCIGNIKAIPRLNFTGLCLLDGPQTINRADLVTIFPSGNCAAATWDEDLMFERGKAMGQEFRGKGGHVQLGPVAGPLGRHALGGRNWEGFSPDPYLTGKAMYATVQGIQSVGVQACSKHYIANEQETQRTNSFQKDGTEILAISSNMDDRTLPELYLWPFAEAIRAGTSSIMCSYNRVNQTYACENPYLLNEILRKELGFQGYVVSDWFATHSGKESINAGLDMNMPGAYDQAAIIGRTGQSYWGQTNVTKMIKEGTVSKKRLDEMVLRIMLPYFYLGQDKNYPSVDPSLTLTLATQSGFDLSLLPISNVPSRDVRADHASLVRRMGADGTVLLKNTRGALPLKMPKTIGIFGNDAPPPTNGIVFESPDPFEIGTIDIGGGSGTGRHTYLVSPLEAIMAKAKTFGARVQYITRNEVLAANDFRSLYPVPEVCLVFLNSFASEGWDRTSYEADWNSTLAVQNVARKCSNTIVVTHTAGVVSMPWANNPNVTAILAAHYPGQESGNSIVDILWGVVNPSGRLPYSIPASKTGYDIPIVNLTEAQVTSPEAWQANFTEGQFIDYRHFDRLNLQPLYEFGFGLSYTTYALRGKLMVKRLVTKVEALPDSKAPVLPGGNAALWSPLLRLQTVVSNTGSMAGASVVQLYMSFPQGSTPTGAPVKVLRGFRKVWLQPGESKRVTFDLIRKDLSYWDSQVKQWTISEGAFIFHVGFSSRDLRVTTKHTLRQ